MLVSKTLLSVMVLAHCLCEAQLASADPRSFKVQFAGCTEFVGWGPVSLAAAQPLVPAGYVIAGAVSGQAAIVARSHWSHHRNAGVQRFRVRHTCPASRSSARDSAPSPVALPETSHADS